MAIFMCTPLYNVYNGTTFPANSMYMVTSKGVVLFDTPWDTARFQPLLDSIQQRHHTKVIMCIASLFHEDRTGGFDYFRQQGIATRSSTYTKQLCTEHSEKQAAFVFTKDTTFIIGNHRFRTFYPGEGHTKDNIVFWFEKEKILYGGCFVKSTEASGLGNLSDANPHAWEQSVHKLLTTFPAPVYVIPGHQDWRNNQSLLHTLQLVQQYLQQQKVK